MCFFGGGSSAPAYPQPPKLDPGRLIPRNNVVGQDLPGPERPEEERRRITNPDDLRRPYGSTGEFLASPGDSRTGTRSALTTRSTPTTSLI